MNTWVSSGTLEPVKCHQIKVLKSKSNKIVAGEFWGTLLRAFDKYYSAENGISIEMDYATEVNIINVY